jgi:RNA polymerase sigma factor (sigma-70 family)
MAGESREAALFRDVQTLFGLGVVGGWTDGQLLEQFLTADDATAEAVFTTLVERHGAMVLHVCRQTLDDPHDAQDAFQATFLVFLQRARSIRKPESVASWLFGVALRVARRARYGAVVRRFHERQSGKIAATRAGSESGSSECQVALHEEIARLPARYRESVVLCHLEGLSTAVAAQRLGCAHGTILSRLARARERLRRRLTGRGLTVPVGLLAADLVPHEAAAALAAAPSYSTVKAMVRSMAGRAALVRAASPAVAALTHATLRSLFMTRLTLSAAVLATAAALTSVTIPLVRTILAADSRDSLPGEGLQTSGEKPRPKDREADRSRDLEDTFFTRLKREHEFNDPQWPYWIKVRDVQDRTLIDATWKHKVGGKGNDFDLVIQAKRAKVHFDRGAKLARVYLDEGEVQHLRQDADVVLIDNRILEFPIPTESRFMTAQAPAPPRPQPLPVAKEAMVDSDQALSLAYSSDGKTLITAGFQGTIDLWDLVENRKVGSFKGEPSVVRFVTFAPDGRTLASVGNEGTVKLWDVPAGTMKRTIPSPSESIRRAVKFSMSGCVAFAPDGHHLAITAWGSEEARYIYEVRVFDARDGQLVWSHLGRGEGAVSLAFAPDGKTLASAGWRAVKLWDAQTGEPLRTLKPDRGGIYDVVFSPDGRMLAGGERFMGDASREPAELVTLWDVKTGEILRTMEGQTGKVGGVGIAFVAISPDGKTVALGGAGHVRSFGRMQKVLSDIRLWEIATGKPLWAFEGELGPVNSLSFSPDGKTLTYCDSRSVGMIDVQTGKIERILKSQILMPRP